MLTLRPGTTWFLTIRCWHLSLWLRLVMAINNTRQKKMHIEFWILIIKRWQEAMTIELNIEYQSLNIEYWHLNIGDFCITLTIKKLTWSRMMQEEELFQSLKLTPHILMTACLHSWTCLEKAKNSIDWHMCGKSELIFVVFLCFYLFGLKYRLESIIAGKQKPWDPGEPLEPIVADLVK